MDNEINKLREWAPLTELLEKIPTRIQKGIFSHDLNITCIDVIPEFIALGTDAGIVFWANRSNGDIQKLRNETSSSISCVKICSSVEYMVAAGSTNGQVNVFQIQKELPSDLNLVAPITKTRPIERYTIRDLHKDSVSCCEWSKNGMKLFSGDRNGVVVLTEFDYQSHLSKSIEILNEAYDIVQLCLNQSYLLVSTIYRSIICERDQKIGRWRISQIGKKDRKIMSNFGATFRDKTTRPPTLLCSRPGLRFWIADCQGTVQQTLLFKDAIEAMQPNWEIPLLNPTKYTSKPLNNFGKIYIYLRNYIITYDETVLYILNMDKLIVEAITQSLRGIVDISICGKEIFILEGPRSLIRISTCPEPQSKTAKIIFNPLLPPPIPALVNFNPIEFEPEEEAIGNAEECFELPPIQHLDLTFPLKTDLDSPRTQQNKLIMEQSRKIEIFDKINEMKFDESILYHSGIGKKHRKPSSSTKKKSKNEKSGIVEIGQAIIEKSNENHQVNDNNLKSKEYLEKQKELTTIPQLLEASFCIDPDLAPDLRSPDTLKRDLIPKEKALAEALNLEPIKLIEISERDMIKSIRQQKSDNQLPVWQYPLNYSIISNLGDAEVQTTPRKKLHFISDDEDDLICTINNDHVDGSSTTNYEDLCDDIKNVMIKSDCGSNSNSNYSHSNNNLLQNIQVTNDKKMMKKSLQFVPCQITPMASIATTSTRTSTEIPDIQQMPDCMKIPSIWNMKIETAGEDVSEHSDSQISGDWELVDS